MMTNLRHSLLYGLALLALAAFTDRAEAGLARLDAPADEAFDQLPLQHHDQVTAWTEQQREAHADDAHIWIRPGIRADRKTREVILWADATGLAAENPLEFLLISESSGHDYEAVAVSYAMPSDVRTALEFIGVPAGAPVNPQALRFFPKGEPIAIYFEWTVDGETVEWRAESLVRDLRTQASLPTEGFTFVGSRWIERDGEQRLAADVLGPNSIVSLYNETTTVLDMPTVARQSEVYGFLQPHPERIPPIGKLLSVRLTPARAPDTPQVANLTLRMESGDSARPIHLHLAEPVSSEVLHETPSLDAVLVALSEIRASDRMPFVQLELAGDVPLNEIRDLSRILQRLEQDQEVQVEPPPEREPYYRAFIPREQHRERANRPSQALELNLQHGDTPDALEVVLKEIRDVRERREDEPLLEVTPHPVESPSDLVALVETIHHRLPVMIVFAPEDLLYERLLEWIQPIMDRHPTIHIFMTPGFGSESSSAHG